MAFFLKNKKEKGSALLVFALIITIMTLVISIGLMSVSTSEIKTSSVTDKSTVAVQIADTGIERVMRGIKDAANQTDTLTVVFGASCSSGDVSGSIAGGDYAVSFFNRSGGKLNCSDEIGEVAKIKSIGTYRMISRAMDKEVCVSGWEKTGAANGTWDGVAVSNDGQKLIAAIRGSTNYTSIDEGISWTSRGGIGPWDAVASSGDGNTLLTVAQGSRLWYSTDSGINWEPFGGGPVKNWVAAGVSDNGTHLGAVYGGLAAGRVYLSANSGVNWSDIMVGGTPKGWLGIAFSANGSRVAVVNAQGEAYTSDDEGMTWNLRLSVGGGNPLVGVAMSDDGIRMMAVSINGLVYRSTNGGVNWIPLPVIAGLTALSSIAMSQDGMIVAVAEGSVISAESGYIYVSEDGGDTWEKHDPAGGARNWSHDSVTMSADGKKIFVSNSDAADGIWKYTQCD